MNRIKLIGVVCTFAALTTASLAQDPMAPAAPAPPATAPTAVAPATFTMKRTVRVGETFKYKLKADLEFGGMQAGFTSNITEKVTDVSAEGNYKIESSQADSKVNMNGQEQDVPQQGGNNTIAYNASGEVLAITGDMVESGAYRMANLGVLKAPDAPVKVGDSWTYKIPANTKTGAVAALAEYSIVALEKIGDRDCLKISGNVKETEGSQPASNVGTVWVDATDFSMVKSDTTWTNAPIPGAPGPISGKVVLNRV